MEEEEKKIALVAPGAFDCLGPGICRDWKRLSC